MLALAVAYGLGKVYATAQFFFFCFPFRQHKQDMLGLRDCME
jgi:hypothetical protein